MRTTTKTAIALSALLGLCALSSGYHRATETTMTCTVIDTDRVYNMDGQVRGYRLHTTCGVLDLRDVPTYWAWDSIELYRSIEAGETYTFTTTGINNTVIDAEPAD
jgi:hypothetical protein